MIHAFFKALLFLAAGVVIQVLDEEHDIFKMGGLRKKMPAVFWTFLIGSASLSAVPLITAGFYSKDAILWFAYSSNSGGMILWLAGIVGAFLTALYSFRMIFITFYGEVKTEPSFTAGRLMTVPLIILAVLSVVGGFIEIPASTGNIHLFSDLINYTLPATVIRNVEHLEWLFQIISSLIALSGIYLAYRFYYLKPQFIDSFNHSRLNHFFEKGFEFDKLYHVVFVKPIVWLAEVDKKDFFDLINISIANMVIRLNLILSIAQNGKLRWYLLSFAIGIAFILTLMLKQ